MLPVLMSDIYRFRLTPNDWEFCLQNFDIDSNWNLIISFWLFQFLALLFWMDCKLQIPNIWMSEWWHMHFPVKFFISYKGESFDIQKWSTMVFSSLISCGPLHLLCVKGHNVESNGWDWTYIPHKDDICCMFILINIMLWMIQIQNFELLKALKLMCWWL